MTGAYITFAQHQIAVGAVPDDVRAAIHGRFQAMMTAQPTAVLSCINVRQQGTRYWLARADGRGEQTATDLPGILAHIENESTVQFISAYSHLAWFHAGAVARGGQALLFAGEWGQGKSTLATTLVARDWRYLSDEFAPVCLEKQQVLPFPLTPRVRRSAGAALPRGAVAQLQRVVVQVPPTRVATAPVAIAALIFPEFVPGAPAQLTPLSPAQATLRAAAHYVNLGQCQTAVSRLITFTRTIPAFQLRYHNATDAARLAARALPHKPQPDLDVGDQSYGHRTGNYRSGHHFQAAAQVAVAGAAGEPAGWDGRLSGQQSAAAGLPGHDDAADRWQFE